MAESLSRVEQPTAPQQRAQRLLASFEAMDQRAQADDFPALAALVARDLQETTEAVEQAVTMANGLAADLMAAEARLRVMEEALEAARDVAATHHGQWRTRITSGGNEHVPKTKLEQLRSALAALGSVGVGEEGEVTWRLDFERGRTEPISEQEAADDLAMSEHTASFVSGESLSRVEQPTAHAQSLSDKLRRAAEEGQSPWTDEGTCLVFSDAAKTLEVLAASLREAEQEIARLGLTVASKWSNDQVAMVREKDRARLRVAEEALQQIVDMPINEAVRAAWHFAEVRRIAREAVAALGSVGVGDEG